MVRIDRGAKGVALAVTADRHMLDTITDGDVRRVILAGIDLDLPVAELLKRKQSKTHAGPVTASSQASREELIDLMRKRSVRQIPLLDDEGRVVDLVTVDELLPSEPAPLRAVIVAGGLGTGLRPLTEGVPKAMLPVGEYKITLSDAELEQMHLSVAIGIGTPPVVARVVRRLAVHQGLSFPNLVHPGTIWDEPRVALGQGNVICAGNLLTTDIRFGSYNFVNLGCMIGHDVVVGDCCVVNPRACISGGVKIGNECLIGAGATILQYITIGDRAVVGAGAVVTKDVEPGTTVVGVPARATGKT
jgi:sugar O-acyltransferase (sialic acid O-acetyltransferase NeuD family)